MGNCGSLGDHTKDRRDPGRKDELKTYYETSANRDDITDVSIWSKKAGWCSHHNVVFRSDKEKRFLHERYRLHDYVSEITGKQTISRYKIVRHQELPNPVNYKTIQAGCAAKEKSSRWKWGDNCQTYAAELFESTKAISQGKCHDTKMGRAMFNDHVTHGERDRQLRQLGERNEATKYLAFNKTKHTKWKNLIQSAYGDRNPDSWPKSCEILVDAKRYQDNLEKEPTYPAIFLFVCVISFIIWYFLGQSIQQVIHS